MKQNSIVNIDTYKNLVAQPRLFEQHINYNLDQMTPIQRETIIIQEPFNRKNYKNNTTEKELKETLKKLIQKDAEMKEMEKYIRYLRLNQKQQFEHVDVTASAIEAEKQKQKHKKSKQESNESDDEDLNNMTDQERQVYFLKQLQKLKSQIQEQEINRRQFPQSYDEVINLLLLQQGQNQLSEDFLFGCLQQHTQDDFMNADAIILPETIKNYYKIKDMGLQLETQDDFFDQLLQKQQNKIEKQQNINNEHQEDENDTKFAENDYYIE